VALHSSALRVQPLDRQPRMQWRNGGGETREVCAWPPGAGLDDFAWRVSVATIERDGPFSRFPGIVRTAVLLDGAGLRLRAGAEAIHLAAPFAQATFDGALPWQCELEEERVQVFNVMVRAGMTARVTVADAPFRATPARFCVVYAARASTRGQAGGEPFALSEGDACVVADAGAPPVRVEPAGAAARTLVACIDGTGHA
jgi:hypothetical protein